MKLLTKAIEHTIPALYSTEEVKTQDKTIVCKFFALGSDWTWYVVEGGRQENGNYLFFGLVIGFEKEWGYFTLEELLTVKWHGIPGIERDLYFKAVTVGECRELNPKARDRHYADPAQITTGGEGLMKNEFLSQEKCSRCGGALGARTMSRMNEDVLCMDCVELEKAHPRYQEASEAELEQVKAGNYNYLGLFTGKRYPF